MHTIDIFCRRAYILHTLRALLYKRQSGNDRLQQQAGRQQHYISSSIACEIAAALYTYTYSITSYRAHTFGVNTYIRCKPSSTAPSLEGGYISFRFNTEWKAQFICDCRYIGMKKEESETDYYIARVMIKYCTWQKSCQPKGWAGVGERMKSRKINFHTVKRFPPG